MQIGAQVSLHEFSDWLSATPFSQAIQITPWAIPGIQVIHIICIAALFAAALMFSLRLAGKGLSVEPLHLLAERFTGAMWLLLLILLLSGGLLITAEPGRTVGNPVFYLKMVLVLIASGITLWLSAAAKRQFERPRTVHIAGAALVMLTWIAIIFAGRFIAYVESY
jgi:hypothetical protein